MAKISINLSTGSLQKEEIIVGIDLGTSNSLVAFINPEKVATVINDNNKGLLVPSVIHFEPNGEVLVGTDAKNKVITDPSNTIFSVKRLLGRSYKDIADYTHFFGYKIIDNNDDSLVKIQVADKFYTPIELSAMILRELKARAEHALKTPVNRAVITVPAYFNDSQRQATRDAGKLAGLDVLRIVNEPTAAALAYGIGLRADESKTIAVYDLGGGTFDISILRIENGIFEVLSTNGNTFLGGDDFDQAILNFWLEKNKLSAAEIQNQPSLYQALRIEAETAKKHLTTYESFEKTVENIHCSLTKSEFENLITPIIAKTIICTTLALTDAQLTTTDIETVIMVGGSTRTELVQKMVTDFFGKAINTSLNPDEVIALGAAIQADILAGNRKDILLLDVTPLSLGIETMGGLMDVLIPRNNKIPTKAGRQYTTAKDGQTGIKIAVYQGERDLVSLNRKLGEFELKGIPAMPAGLPKVDINFMLNADGILTVQAIELRSQTTQEIIITPAYGLTDAEVEQRLIDSMQNAQADIQLRMVLEATNEAEQLKYAAERFIEKNKTLLDVEEVKNTMEFIKKLSKAVEFKDKDKIHVAIEELNEYTRPFAERVMELTVSSALKGKAITKAEF